MDQKTAQNIVRDISVMHSDVFEEARQTHGQELAIVGTIVFISALLSVMQPIGQARFLADLFTLLGKEHP